MTKEELKKEMGARLTVARHAAGYADRRSVVEKFGWNENTYKSHEYGTREFSRDYAKIYSDAFGVAVEHLLALDLLDRKTKKIDSGRFTKEYPIAVTSKTIPVHGESAGGIWREGADRPMDEYEVAIPANPRYPSSAQYARRVVGSSVSNRILDGDYAVILRYDMAPAHMLQPGVLVDVERIRSGMREHTIKVFAGDNRLMTDSREMPEQQELIKDHTDEDTEVRIAGIVISSYRNQI